MFRFWVFEGFADAFMKKHIYGTSQMEINRYFAYICHLCAMIYGYSPAHVDLENYVHILTYAIRDMAKKKVLFGYCCQSIPEVAEQLVGVLLDFQSIFIVINALHHSNNIHSMALMTGVLK